MFCINAIPCFSWSDPSTPPRALLMCIHGLGLHGGVYRPFGEGMSRFGINTFSIDVRGFGNWNKEQLCSLDFDNCVSDIANKIEELQETYPGLPVFILGESMGGAIATRFVAEFEHLVHGLILCAPARTICEHKREILRILAHLVMQPHKPFELSSTIIEHAPLMDHEPQVRLHFSITELFHMARLFFTASNFARRIARVPVLVLQGHDDRIVTVHSTLKFFDKLATPEKQLVVLGSAEHLLLQTQEVHNKVMAIVRDWLEEKLDENEPHLRLVS